MLLRTECVPSFDYDALLAIYAILWVHFFFFFFVTMSEIFFFSFTVAIFETA